MSDSNQTDATALLSAEADYEQRIRGLEARVLDLQNTLANSQGPDWQATVDEILRQSVDRLLRLEENYITLKNFIAAERTAGLWPRIVDETLRDLRLRNVTPPAQKAPELSQQKVDETLRGLAKKTIDAQPQITYFNERFRDYETALRNIKNLAADRGIEFYERYGSKSATGPGFVPLKAKGCTQEDMHSDWVAFWCNELHIPVTYHRKCWELCYVSQILYNEGKLHNGSRGLGFACGNEPLPSLFAKYGVKVLATDLEPVRAEAQGWVKTNQHVRGFEKLRRPDICPDESRLATIEGAYVDMNAIPASLDGQFDFCWSICSLEHLGSLANGMDFIENSLRCLKPGGVSVHTTEFNVNDGETIDNWPTVLYQKHHFRQLAERLRSKGFCVYEFDFDSGQGILDGFVDIPPFIDENYPVQHAHAHLKVSVDGFVCTSFGFIVKTAADTARADIPGEQGGVLPQEA